MAVDVLPVLPIPFPAHQTTGTAQPGNAQSVIDVIERAAVTLVQDGGG